MLQAIHPNPKGCGLSRLVFVTFTYCGISMVFLTSMPWQLGKILQYKFLDLQSQLCDIGTIRVLYIRKAGMDGMASEHKKTRI